MITSLVISTLAFFVIGIYAKRYLIQNGYAEGGGAKMLAFVIATLGSFLVGGIVDKVEDQFKSPAEVQQDQQEQQQLTNALKQLRDAQHSQESSP